jgi:hypothetical protein
MTLHTRGHAPVIFLFEQFVFESLDFDDVFVSIFPACRWISASITSTSSSARFSPPLRSRVILV